jgi:histidinol-phosphate phosphatase family protein
MSTREKTLRPAVFLDRDGTMIEDRGDLSHESQVVFFSNTIAALRHLQKRFELFMVTNQGGVSRGTLTIDQVNRVNTHIMSHLASAGVRIIETYVCPHLRSEGCACIKPKPYFLHKAKQEHGIDLQSSFTIGDHPHDVEFAHNVNGKGVYVLTGHGEKHRAEMPDYAIVASDIQEAADIICNNQR